MSLEFEIMEFETEEAAVLKGIFLAGYDTVEEQKEVLKTATKVTQVEEPQTIYLFRDIKKNVTSIGVSQEDDVYNLWLQGKNKYHRI